MAADIAFLNIQAEENKRVWLPGAFHECKTIRRVFTNGGRGGGGNQTKGGQQREERK